MSIGGKESLYIDIVVLCSKLQFNADLGAFRINNSLSCWCVLYFTVPIFHAESVAVISRVSLPLNIIDGGLFFSNVAVNIFRSPAEGLSKDTQKLNSLWELFWINDFFSCCSLGVFGVMFSPRDASNATVGEGVYSPALILL